MSRLDRFLVSEDWLTTWDVVAQWALNRDVSDHYSVIIKNGLQEQGPKPFRFNNYWMDHPKFKEMVENELGNFSVNGWMGYVLKEKLKLLKGKLKSWNWKVFGNMDNKLIDIETKISRLDVKAENEGLSEEDMGLRRSNFVELWKVLKAKESLLRQKSRIQWLREGDLNSAFFHASLVIRR